MIALYLKTTVLRNVGMKWNTDDEIGEMRKLDGSFFADQKSFNIPLTWLVKLILKWIRR
jgi:hypothetical protein